MTTKLKLWELAVPDALQVRTRNPVVDLFETEHCLPSVEDTVAVTEYVELGIGVMNVTV